MFPRPEANLSCTTYSADSSPLDHQAKHPLVSLVIPVWNDDDLVVDLVNGLQVSPELAEWIVVAVQPGQALYELHRRGAIRLIACDKPSRGRQMNVGAAEARGPLICFHHADSELRFDHLRALEKAARNDEISGGAFHRRFDDRSAIMACWEGLIRRMSLLAGPLFGDQSIFAKASVFKTLGGFADIPLMEDIEFSRRLRRLDRIVLLDPPLWSSPRRFRQLGNWRTTLLNVTLISLFYLRVDPHTLQRWYYHSKNDSNART
jgi:rSAM/selenodomain-associated transferase 2